MKRSRVDTIFVEHAKKRNAIIVYLLVIVLLSALCFSSFILYVQKNKTNYVAYDENSKIDYKVYLKENDFFSLPYLEANNQYIASLINYINADFNYQLSLKEKNVEFDYSYKVIVEVNVEEKDTRKSLYKFNEILIDKENLKSEGRSVVNIKEAINIDYNRYNEIIKRFVNSYALDNVISTLTVKMYVVAVGSCDDFVSDSNNESMISIDIPLTTKTMNIEISDSLVESSNNIMICKKNTSSVILILIISIILLLLTLFIIYKLVRYIITHRTANDLYNKELKKIMSNYHSYIQKINSQFDLKGYQALKVDSFLDMLEIRDAMRQPILMVENKTKTGVYFIIPSNTKILYIYSIKLSDFK